MNPIHHILMLDFLCMMKSILYESEMRVYHYVQGKLNEERK